MIAAQLFDQTVRGVRDVKDGWNVTPLAAVPVNETSGSLALRKRRAAAFVGKTAIAIAVIYYATTRFFFEHQARGMHE